MQPRTAVVEQFLATLKKSEAQELTEAWQEVRFLIGERVPVLQNLCENHDLFIVSPTSHSPQKLARATLNERDFMEMLNKTIEKGRVVISSQS